MAFLEREIRKIDNEQAGLTKETATLERELGQRSDRIKERLKKSLSDVLILIFR